MNDFVQLVVGGKRFETTRETLCKHPGFFTALFERQKEEMHSDGEIKIDRDPVLFCVILNWLRTSLLDIPDNTSAESLVNEFEYYGLPTPSFDLTTSTVKLYGYVAQSPPFAFTSHETEKHELFSVPMGQALEIYEMLNSQDITLLKLIEQFTRFGYQLCTLESIWWNDQLYQKIKFEK